VNGLAEKKNDFGAIAALLRECAFFETGLSDARKSELRKQLMVLSDGEMTDSEFEVMLSSQSIIKPGEFLPLLETIGEIMPLQSRRIFRKVFEDILVVDGPPSEKTAELIENIKLTLWY